MSTELIMLTKFPSVGKVKTRLSARIGSQKACDIYSILLLHNYELLHATNLPITIQYTPKNALPDFKKLFRPPRKFWPQKGKNIGEKMAEAFKSCFCESSQSAILIGGDALNLSTELLFKAKSKLTKADVVIGPAYDRGFYLIGINKQCFNEDFFQISQWSNGEEFLLIQKKILSHDKKIYLLPKRYDLDTLEDLEIFIKSYKEDTLAIEFRKILKANS